jgi:hypothetical protein
LTVKSSSNIGGLRTRRNVLGREEPFRTFVERLDKEKDARFEWPG